MATENGLTEMPIGVDTAMPALVPEPGGTILLNYMEYYSARRTNDGAGNPAVPDFRLDVEAEAPKIVHTWARFNGIDVSSGFVQPLVNIDIQIIPGEVTGHEFNRGDTDLLPLILHTVVGNGLHLETATNIWPRDGFYNGHNPASEGLNRFTVGQQFVTTWLPDKTWDLSTSTLLEFCSKNSTTNYRSGSYCDTDFHIGNRVFAASPKWELGLQGYYMKQFQNDRQNGVLADGDGHKGRAFAFGPQISYDAWEHGAIVVKFQHEVLVENRPTGDKLWVQFALPLQ